jgi:RimJ/RimL family protein N-acetyltransferase
VRLYRPMAMELQTRRLDLRPWTERDAEDYSALTAEREHGGFSVETARERIATHLASAERNGAAAATGRKRLWSTVGSWNAPSLRVLDKLGFHRDHVDPGDGSRGEVVWLTRALP